MQKINRNEITDHGAESIRLGSFAMKKGKRAMQSAKRTFNGTYRAAKVTANVLKTVVIHTAAVLLSPVIWILLVIGVVVYFIIVLLVILFSVADQDAVSQQQAYASPVGLGDRIPEDIRNAKTMLQQATEQEKTSFTDKIENLYFAETDLPHSDTVYLYRNNPAAEYAVSLATDVQKQELCSAWDLNATDADMIGIAYVLLQKQENTAHGSVGVMYPVSFTQDTFDDILSKAVSLTETKYSRQACPEEQCAVHFREEQNPDFVTAKSEYDYAALKLNDWNESVIPKSNAYVDALNTYYNTPTAGQSSVQRYVDSTYAAFCSAVNHWSERYGIWDLNIDADLGADMQQILTTEADDAEAVMNSTPETVQIPYFTCDHVHTLHSLELCFYTADEIMDALDFSAEERQWAKLTAANIRQYLEG